MPTCRECYRLVAEVSPRGTCMRCVERWISTEPRALAAGMRAREIIRSVAGEGAARQADAQIAMLVLFAFLERCRKWSPNVS